MEDLPPLSEFLKEIERETLPQEKKKPYACQRCGLSFWRKFDCKRHFRTHTLEKPFACRQCPRQFARKDALKRHVMGVSHK